MTPGALADYLRTVATYGLTTAAAAGAGYEIIAGHADNPIVPIAATLVGAVLGVHFSGGVAGTNSTDAPPSALQPKPPSPPGV